MQHLEGTKYDRLSEGSVMRRDSMRGDGLQRVTTAESSSPNPENEKKQNESQQGESQATSSKLRIHITPSLRR